MERDLSQLRIDPDRRERKGPGRRLVVSLLLAGALAIAVMFAIVFSRRAPEVETAAVREAGAAQTAVLNASGYVTPRRRATVSAKVTGKIGEVFIDEGMRVAAGQVLARLDDVDAVAALRAAEAEKSVAVATLEELRVQLANARRVFERNKDLRARELVSQESLDNAETAVASYEAQIDLAGERINAAERSVGIARQNVDNCVVRAPFAGIVVSKDAQPGEMVSPISAGGGYTRTGIATIVDMTSLEIEVDVNESYIARVAPDQRVEAVLDAYPDWRIPSKVRTVIPTADRQKATVKVRISFDRLDGRILPDMGVKVSFLEEAADSAAAGVSVLVPREAVRSDGDQRYAFVVKDGRVERRAVGTGRERGSDIEVVAGLRRGETVVVGSGGQLRDGARVSLKKK
ncbi:MAG: efflux RND transporter periplasmic adaptor subunit [Candidatus Krumholzibacteria bacterium]|nr:efflux RND transporter periplasmic adaptor subunit [Candidatus Krumholzibacteria bacterium]